jgi:hypothetical protein
LWQAAQKLQHVTAGVKIPARQLTDHEGVYQHFFPLERTNEPNIGMAEVMDPYRRVDHVIAQVAALA